MPSALADLWLWIILGYLFEKYFYVANAGERKACSAAKTWLRESVGCGPGPPDWSEYRRANYYTTAFALV